MSKQKIQPTKRSTKSRPRAKQPAEKPWTITDDLDHILARLVEIQLHTTGAIAAYDALSRFGGMVTVPSVPTCLMATIGSTQSLMHDVRLARAREVEQSAKVARIGAK